MGKKGLRKGDTGGTVRQAHAQPLNRTSHAAKSAKQDEFNTQYVDVQKKLMTAKDNGAAARLNSPKSDIEDVKLFLKKNKANRIACSLRRSLDCAEGSRWLQRGRWHGAQPAISFTFTGPPK